MSPTGWQEQAWVAVSFGPRIIRGLEYGHG